jgi:4-hydroxy-tetrahydrodipicolinate synthase
MFEGIWTALVTPFQDDVVDEKALVTLVEKQIAAGVDGVVPCGSSGESATLSHDEHRRVTEIVVATARDRVRVVAGTGSNSTDEAIALTQHAKEAGADGALLISPYYNKPTQEGIVAHYAAVARATEFPLVAYNIPGRTQSNVAPDTVARLAEIDCVVGIKEASGDIDQIGAVIAACPEDFSVLAGDDSFTLPLMALGGHGCISVTSNVAPELMTELVRACAAGDFARAREAHFRLLPLFDLLFCETNPIPLKAALELMGLIGGEIRLPLTPITEPNRERLRMGLKDAGLL